MQLLLAALSASTDASYAPGLEAYLLFISSHGALCPPDAGMMLALAGSLFHFRRFPAPQSHAASSFSSRHRWKVSATRAASSEAQFKAAGRWVSGCFLQFVRLGDDYFKSLASSLGHSAVASSLSVCCTQFAHSGSQRTVRCSQLFAPRSLQFAARTQRRRALLAAQIGARSSSQFAARSTQLAARISGHAAVLRGPSSSARPLEFPPRRLRGRSIFVAAIRLQFAAPHSAQLAAHSSSLLTGCLWWRGGGWCSRGRSILVTAIRSLHASPHSSQLAAHRSSQHTARGADGGGAAPASWSLAPQGVRCVHGLCLDSRRGSLEAWTRELAPCALAL